MKLWLLNPRFAQHKRPSNDPDEPAVWRVECDCPCGCVRPFVLRAIAGVFEPDPLNQPQTQQQWRQLLNNCTYAGDTFRVIDTAVAPCGWIGVVRNGRVLTLSDVETDDKLGTKIAETLQKIRERNGEAAHVKG